MFGKDNKENSNEKVLYEGQPNIIVYSKGILIAMILLGFLFVLYSTGIQYIGNMQVYLIESSKTPMTRYFAIAVFILIMVVIAYIIFKILAWTSIKYTITESRVIVEKGLLLSKKNSMPFNTIQDVGRSQSILGKVFSVGTITLYSAYDGNDLQLKDISSPKKVENLIFENMRGTHLRSRNLYDDPYNNPGNYNGPNMAGAGFGGGYSDSYSGNDFKPIRPNSDEKPHYNRMEDLDDLELVDVKERKRNLREIRRKARESRNNNYNNQPIDGPSQYNRNQYGAPNNQYGRDQYGAPNSQYDRGQYGGSNSQYGRDQYGAPSGQYNRKSNYNNSNDYNRPYDNDFDDYNNQSYENNYQGSRNQYRGKSRNHKPRNNYQGSGDQYSDRSRDAYQGSPRQYRDDSRDYSQGNPRNSETIRESYQRNPNKYFAKNYEKFHEDNLKSQSQERDSVRFEDDISPFESRNKRSNYQDYEDNYVSDEEFDSTINQAMQNIGDNIRFEPSQNENNIKRVKVIRKSDLEDSSRHSRDDSNRYREDSSRHSRDDSNRYREDSNRYYDDRDLNDSRPKSNRNSNAYGSKSRIDRAFDDFNSNDYPKNYPNEYDDQYYHDDLSRSSYDYDDSYPQSNNQPVRLNKQDYREDNYNSKKSRFNRNRNRKNKNYNNQNYNQNNYNNQNRYDSSNDYQNSYNQRENNSNHYGESDKKDKKDKNTEKDENDLFAKHSRKFKRS